MQVQPYLFFDNCCQEAVEFYQTALGAEVTMLMHYKDGPEAPPPGMENKVMHASFKIGDSIVMASDDCASKQTGFTGFSLSLAVADEAEAARTFGALAIGGEIRMPLAKTFWSPRFGMVADRFGVLWMINTVS
ncbi:MAG TPA: VOC family protein [Azonexus sp.]|nr:VOC family protein [Azonexus sp.]